MNNSAWLDTGLFAPRPLPEIEADGIASRPDMRMIRTKTARVRIRAQIEQGKPAIIILPDGPNTIEQHDPVFELFRERYSIVAIEPPGLGFSYALHPDALTFKGTVQVVAEVIHSLGLEKLLVTGGCVQAYVAVGVASTLASQVLGVVVSQATDLEGERKWMCSEVDPQGFLREPIVGQLAWSNVAN